jgi:hypothetical protein
VFPIWELALTIVLGLDFKHTSIVTIALHQFIVGAAFDNSSILEDIDAVSQFDARKGDD